MGSWSQGGGRAAFTRMSWTWTGYDYDPVFRYKEEANFFQTGRNNAEARFWQTKVHEGDRRGTKSQIEIGSDGDSVKDHADVAKASSEDSASKDGDREYEEEEDDVRSLGDRDYQYGYGGSQNRDPGQRYFVYEETRHDGHKGRDRTMSIVSTISRKDDWRSPARITSTVMGRLLWRWRGLQPEAALRGSEGVWRGKGNLKRGRDTQRRDPGSRLRGRGNLRRGQGNQLRGQGRLKRYQDRQKREQDSLRKGQDRQTRGTDRQRLQKGRTGNTSQQTEGQRNTRDTRNLTRRDTRGMVRQAKI